MMNSSNSISSNDWASRFGRLARLLPLLALALVLASNPELRAQDAVPFAYVTNQNAITITRYVGTDGVVSIPAIIDGLPVTTIGNNAFYNRSVLTKITLPNSLTAIGNDAFSSCTGLTQISFPDGLATIGDWAFYRCTSLTKITLPNSLTSIGHWAFYGCTSLPQISLPDGLSFIGQGAFRNCQSLTNVTIPDSVGAIQGNYREGVGRDGGLVNDGAFADCLNLAWIRLGAGVTNIGRTAFDNCPNLRAIEADPDNMAFGSEDGVLFTKDRTSIVFFPRGREGSFRIPPTVTNVSSEAFSGASFLTEIDLPESIASIGDWAFYRCTSLTQISFPAGLASIGNWAFYGCTGLTQIALSDSLAAIGDGAFADCSGLTAITPHENLIFIGAYAFFGCTGLTEITLPNSLTQIGDSAFIECPSLVFAKFLGNAPEILASDFFDYVFPSGTTVLHLPGTADWSDTFGGAPTTLWLPSIRQLTNAVGQPGGFMRVPVEWTPQRQIAIDACTDLAHPDWQPVGTVTLDAAGTGQFTDPGSAVAPSRFYRLRVP